MAKWGREWNKERLWSQESPSLWSLTSTPPPLDISVPGHQDCLLDKVFQGMTKRSWKDRTVVIRRHDVETDRDLKFSSFMSLCDLCSDFRLSYSFDNVIYNHEINHQHFSHLKKKSLPSSCKTSWSQFMEECKEFSRSNSIPVPLFKPP